MNIEIITKLPDNSFYMIFDVDNRKEYYFAKLKTKLSLNKRIITILVLLSFIINLYLSQFNFVDLSSSIIGNPILYYINAILGSYTIISLANILLEKCRFLIFIGKNSLIIYVTHFYAIFLALRLTNYNLITF